jgi:LacI family transcriptional regulator
MRKAGLTPWLDDSPNDYDGVEKVLRTALRHREPIDAIFGMRNSIAIYAFQALQSLELKMPSDMALVGFDDFEMAYALRPAVTVAKQPVEALGSPAANLLFDHMHNRVSSLLRGQIVPETLKTNLIIRSSCGCHSK